MEVWDTTPICQFCLSPLGLGEQCAVCEFAWEVQTTYVEMALQEERQLVVMDQGGYLPSL